MRNMKSRKSKINITFYKGALRGVYFMYTESDHNFTMIIPIIRIIQDILQSILR